MSTKFTTHESPEELAEPLTVLLEAASQSVLQSLLERLRARGYRDVTVPHLILFGNLDCGATHAAQIAQRMQVSRQAISKTLRELQSLEFLRLEDDPQRRNQKIVVMTDLGMQFAIDARGALDETERALAERMGQDTVERLREALEIGWGSASSHHE